MINRVTLIGRLTNNVDLKSIGADNTAVGTFTLASQRSFTNQQGERDADFINCVIWRKPAENLAKFTKKGDLLGIDGRLQTRTYKNNEDKTVYVTEVVVEQFQLLEPKKEGNGNGGNNNQQFNNNNQNQQFNNNQQFSNNQQFNNNQQQFNNNQNQQFNNNQNQQFNNDPFGNQGNPFQSGNDPFGGGNQGGYNGGGVSEDDLPF